jgi:hypothetical protein
MRPIRSALKRILGEPMLGVIDYVRQSPRQGWIGPFNGQVSRLRLVETLIERCDPWAFLETGTGLGTTTRFFAATGRPVFTIELNARIYGHSRARLWHYRNVKQFRGDSRTILRALFDQYRRELEGRTLFVYLDAHWYEDLPLAEEIDIVFAHCPGAVVMIDDFQVPFDSGFKYDDYGPRQALTASYIAPAVGRFNLGVFYPSTPASEEGGASRGCVVLARDASHIAALDAISLLRRGETL